MPRARADSEALVLAERLIDWYAYLDQREARKYHQRFLQATRIRQQVWSDAFPDDAPTPAAAAAFDRSRRSS